MNVLNLGDRPATVTAAIVASGARVVHYLYLPSLLVLMARPNEGVVPSWLERKAGPTTAMVARNSGREGGSALRKVWARKRNLTRRERLLAETNAVMPRSTLAGLIAPHYPIAGVRGRPPMSLEGMLRICCLQ